MYRLGSDNVLARPILFLVVYIIVTDHIPITQAHTCEVGQEHDDNHIWRWVLPYNDPCQCTRIVYGGANTQRPKRRYKPVYVDTPLATSDINKIRKHYNLKCIDLKCPPTNVTSTDHGKATAMAQYTYPVTADSTGKMYDVTCLPTSGTNLTIGTSTVVCQVTDWIGNKKTCHFDVIVKDNEVPAITKCPENQTLNSDPGLPTAVVKWSDPEATDNSGDSPTVTCDPKPGSHFTIGSTQVICTAVDGYGNEDRCTFFVEIEDNEVPGITACPENQTQNTDPGLPSANVTWDDPVAIDNSRDIPTVTCEFPSASNFTIGSTTVICTAVDGYGNENNCSFVIDIEDNEDPVITACPENKIQSNDPGMPSAVVIWEDPVATDNSRDNLTYTCQPPSGSTFDTGSSKEVICTAEDRYKNEDKCSFLVFVVELEGDCLDQLGMQYGRIEEEQITASSTYVNTTMSLRFHGAYHARLSTIQTVNNCGGWCAGDKNAHQWIQVNLRGVMRVTGVMIQGRNGQIAYWVTEFKVLYRMYGAEWMAVQTEDDHDMIFDGNIDQDSVVIRLFPTPVRTSHIRIQPLQWHGYVCMRFELLGCADSEWQLAFKAVSGITEAPGSGDFDEFDPFQVWQRPEAFNEDKQEARQLNTVCKGHYKSPIVKAWNTSHIDQVMVVLLDDIGTEFATFLFNGDGSNNLNWFSPERLLLSPYEDITREDHSFVGNYFSIEGVNVDGQWSRRWFINKNYGGCPIDRGWLAVAYNFEPPCDWAKRGTTRPIFLFSLRNINVNWNSLNEIVFVDGSTSFSSNANPDFSNAQNAVDGNTDGDYHHGSCSHTSADYTDHWWKVDIGTEVCVGAVEIYNREDCCRERLLPAIVQIGNSDIHGQNAKCSDKITQEKIDARQNVFLVCNLRGRYISISAEGIEPLNFCEVKAYRGSCDASPLGLQDRRVGDQQITASSNYTLSTGVRRLPQYGRLHNDSFWAPLTKDRNPWIQVGFNSPVGFTGIKTQGAGHNHEAYVTKLSVKVGRDENSLTPIMKDGIEKIFDANDDGDSVENIRFPVTVFGRLLHIIPRAWNNMAAMRIEVFGYYTDVGMADIFAIFVHTNGSTET